MKKVLAFTLLILAVLVSSASADHRRHRGHHKGQHHGDARGGVFVRTSPVRIAPYSTFRRVLGPGQVRVVRRPIFVAPPVIAFRYHDYRRRPALVAENYEPMAGYYWVSGQWTWNGYEWIWQPGHYEPYPSHVESNDVGRYDRYGAYDGYDRYDGDDGDDGGRYDRDGGYDGYDGVNGYVGYDH
jgi:hypothetical protein